jgi:hypothetical protein
MLELYSCFLFCVGHAIAQAVTSLSMLQPGFISELVHVLFVVDGVALGQIFCEYFSLPLSVSLRQSSIPFIHLSLTPYSLNN